MIATPTTFFARKGEGRHPSAGPWLVDELRAGIDVADIGCGSGHAVNLMATARRSRRSLSVQSSAARTEIYRGSRSRSLPGAAAMRCKSRFAPRS
jgi:hypothetical protein